MEAKETDDRRAPRRRSRIEVRRFAGPEQYVDQLDGLRIVHLTDLHYGRVTPERVQRDAVQLANESEPDLVVITGDFVAHSHMFLDQMVDVLQGLTAPAIGVLGNHDYWSGHREVERALARADVEVLRNAHTTITLRHQPLQVLGLDDAYTGHADRRQATRGLRRDRPVLGLSHIAEEADGLWSDGVPLVLSGHTHAGQITLARLHELAIGRLAGHKYVHGMYGSRRLGRPPAGAVYVGAGIGASVMPVRLGERGRREMTVFELGRAMGSIDEHHDDQPALAGRPVSAETVARRHRRALAIAERRLRKKK